MLSLDIEVENRVSTVNLVVEGGSVVFVAPGSAAATVTLSASGVTVAKRDLQPVQPGHPMTVLRRRHRSPLARGPETSVTVQVVPTDQP